MENHFDIVHSSSPHNGSLQAILVVNAGSSSLKFRVYAIQPDHELLSVLGGQVSGIGGERPAFKVMDGAGTLLVDDRLGPENVRDLGAAQDIMATWLQERLPQPPVAVGHRIVHGGPEMTRSVLVSRDILDYLDSLIPLAPLHQQNNLAPVHVIMDHWPEIQQVVCFDTAFHRRQESVAQYFALPSEFHEQGIRRYGFHGLSYEYIVAYLRAHLPEVAQGRVIAAHLGSGASACAIVDGVSRESTMGFTALDGLPMATRPGRLDPGILLWMMKQGMGHDEIQDLLYNRSGMKGLSGISGDMRTLLESDEPAARLAVDYFNYRTAGCIAGLGVASNGMDAIVFTAGIGEHSPQIRSGICAHLGWLGIELDEAANQQNAPLISSPQSRVTVHVIPTNEELIIARQTYDTIRGVL